MKFFNVKSSEVRSFYKKPETLTCTCAFGSVIEVISYREHNGGWKLENQVTGDVDHIALVFKRTLSMVKISERHVIKCDDSGYIRHVYDAYNKEILYDAFEKDKAKLWKSTYFDMRTVFIFGKDHWYAIYERELEAREVRSGDWS